MVILSAEAAHLTRANSQATHHQQDEIFGKYSATNL